jgi:hypothetical protein
VLPGATGGSGTSGSSGTSGASGTSGTSGVSGTSGTSGANGANGTSGTSGNSGTSGTSGNGTSGTSGTSPSGGTTINPSNGFIPYRQNSTTFQDSPFFYNGTNTLYSDFSGDFIGLYLNYNIDVYRLGDWNGVFNSQYIEIDDSALYITNYTDNAQWVGNITDNNPHENSGRYWRVIINGTTYYIQLNN